MISEAVSADAYSVKRIHQPVVKDVSDGAVGRVVACAALPRARTVTPHIDSQLVLALTQIDDMLEQPVGAAGGGPTKIPAGSML
jgi:hypothetical protein